MRVNAAEIAELVDGTVVGPADTVITGISGLAEAGPGDVTFLADAKYLPVLAESRASAVLVRQAQDRHDLAQIVVADPNASFITVVEAFGPRPRPLPRRIDASAHIGDGAVLGEDLAIGPGVVIGPGCRIDDGCTIHANCVIGCDCVIGTGCLLHPNVTIREGCQLGRNVILHAGAVIGSDGFGYASIAGVHRKIPQVGIVVIEDDVEIGANTTIDRARFDKTVIGAGTKVDNLVMIAHNVVIGAHGIICGQVGLSGSATIGDHVTLLGQCGISGHISLGDGCIVGGQAGVTKNVPPRGIMRGSPAQDMRTAQSLEIAVRRLPKTRQTIKHLEARVAELEQRLAEGGPS